VTLSKTYYVYNYDPTDLDRSGKTDGNPTRIITEYPSTGGMAAESAAAATAMKMSSAASVEPAGGGEG
jgi:hypothetical protein